MVGCTRPEGSEEPTTSSNGNRRKRELQEFVRATVVCYFVVQPYWLLY